MITRRRRWWFQRLYFYTFIYIEEGVWTPLLRKLTYHLAIPMTFAGAARSGPFFLILLFLALELPPFFAVKKMHGFGNFWMRSCYVELPVLSLLLLPKNCCLPLYMRACGACGHRVVYCVTMDVAVSLRIASSVHVCGPLKASDYCWHWIRYWSCFALNLRETSFSW